MTGKKIFIVTAISHPEVVHLDHCVMVAEIANDPERPHALRRILASVIGGPR